MITIDSYAYSSKIADVKPNVKFMFAGTPLLLTLFLNSLSVSICTFIFISFFTLKLSRVSFIKYLRFLALPLAFLIFGSLSVIVNRYELTENILLGIASENYIYGITVTSFLFGAKLMLRAIAAVSCVYFISFNTPMNAVFESLDKSFLPKYIVSLMELIYRYIFIVISEAEKIMMAQKSRLGYRSFKLSINSLGLLLSLVFISSFRRADRQFSALESRGFNGQLKTIEAVYSSSPMLNIATVAVAFTLTFAWLFERSFLG